MSMVSVKSWRAYHSTFSGTTSALVTRAALGKKGACIHCRACKVKCKWIDSNSMCKSCESNGLLEGECMMTGTGSKPPSEGMVQHATCSQSLLPAISMPVVPDSISAAVEELGQVQESTHVAGRRHSYSQATNGLWTSELEHQHT